MILAEQTVVWEERLLLARSLRHAQAAEAKLQRRLQGALADLEALNQKGRGHRRPKSRPELELWLAARLQANELAPLLEVRIEELPASARKRPWEFHLSATVNQEALRQRVQTLGWQVYATSAPETQLSLEQAVRAYRSEYLLENNFRRLKGTLSLQPLYLQREDRLVGLVHLLTLALRVMTVMEFTVRRALQQQEEPLRQIYRGSPNRATRRPTTELLLKAFDGIALIGISQGQERHWFLTPLSATQNRILALLGLPGDLYSRLQQVTPLAQSP